MVAFTAPVVVIPCPATAICGGDGSGGDGGGGGGVGKPDAPSGNLQWMLLTKCGRSALQAGIAVWSQLHSLDVADNRLASFRDVFTALCDLESL